MDKNYLLGHWYAYIYDQHENDLAEVQRILSCLGEGSKNILEVACGTGRISIPLAKAGHSVTGFDISKYEIERLNQKARGLTNINCYTADALVEDWGSGYDAVILAGTVLHNIVTNGDYKQAQELLIKKAASCVKLGGYMFINFDCWGNEKFISNNKGTEWIIFEGTDDIGTYGKFIGISGKSDIETRVDRSVRRYEITPNGRERFSVERKLIKHFPSYELVKSWLDKYGWEIEKQNPIKNTTFRAEIWARKK